MMKVVLLHERVNRLKGHLPPVKRIAGSEECSSSESGWTTYLASPDLEHDQADNEEDDEYGMIGHEGFKKGAEEEEEEAAANSDDSMASDASSGPSDQRFSYGYLSRSHGFSHEGNKDKMKSLVKKHNQQEEKKKQIKGEKDNSGSRGKTAGRLKKV